MDQNPKDIIDSLNKRLDIEVVKRTQERLPKRVSAIEQQIAA